MVSRDADDPRVLMTLGLRYEPKEWLLIRPEVRYDSSQSHPAFSNDTRKSQLTLGFDVLVLS
jgi:hypothetical protein